MTFTAWRVLKEKHQETAFTGMGAKKWGGRWNSKGSPVVYVAGTLSLAILETLVHLEEPTLLSSYVCCPVKIPKGLVKILRLEALPSHWADQPLHFATQGIGDEWLRSEESAVLQVPSATYRVAGDLVPESNFLLNPLHKDFAKIELGGFTRLQLDQRLFA